MTDKIKDIVRIKNCETVKLDRIPILQYADFIELNSSLVKDGMRHLSHYFAAPAGKNLRIISIVADDAAGDIICSSSLVPNDRPLSSATALHQSFHPFERDIHEKYGLHYTDHPWLKPLRFPAGIKHPKDMTEYPFYSYEGEDLHEVGVGPIHAGVIEPGHFRFICNGEKVLHLEIQLGYQHRGVEELFIKKKSLLERVILSESIAGDTTNGNAAAFSQLYESLCGFRPGEHLSFVRTLALELERMAIHTGDLSALAGDVAYQLGNAVFGRLRTPIINYTQSWGGNRLGRGLIRPGRTNFPYTSELAESLVKIFNEYEPHYTEMADTLFARPSVQARFEKTGILSKEDILAMGTVGTPARSTGVKRDIRSTHPHGYYLSFKHEPVLLPQGDVYARAYIRDREIRQSMSLIRKMITAIPAVDKNVDLSEKKCASESLSVSLVEGWRGEICHAAITDKNGNIALYKIKDPSMHNWFALAMAVRGEEISDFPLCNKSFNLSYCGHDL
jgi:Ni,Fe-hydrogenase III large subunit